MEIKNRIFALEWNKYHISNPITSPASNHKNIIYLNNDIPINGDIIDPQKIEGYFKNCITDEIYHIVDMPWAYRKDYISLWPEEYVDHITKTYFLIFKIISERKIKCFYNFFYHDQNPFAGLVEGMGLALQKEIPSFKFRSVSLPQQYDQNVFHEFINSTLITSSSFFKITDQKPLSIEIPKPITIDSHELDSNDAIYNKFYKKTFIITGNGAIARVLSQYLSENYNSNIIIWGRRSLNNEELHLLKSKGVKLYLKVDPSNIEILTSAWNYSKNQFNKIDGIFHMAGALNDKLFKNKTYDDFRNTIYPKVDYTLNLSKILRNEALDFFVSFSSLSGIIGNIGQTDYASANAFLRHWSQKMNNDQIPTYCIDWGLWDEGGMTMNKSDMISPMSSDFAIEALKSILAKNIKYSIVYRGVDSLLSPLLAEDNSKESNISNKMNDISCKKSLENDGLLDSVKKWVRDIVIHHTSLHNLEDDESIISMGADSIASINIVSDIENDLQKVSPEISIYKTLLFDYPSIDTLSEYLLNDYHDSVALKFHSVREDNSTFSKNNDDINSNKATHSITSKLNEQEEEEDDDIAIVGIAGRFPRATDISHFWENIIQGKNCIQIIPKDRWDWRKDFDLNQSSSNKSYGRHGGFLDSIKHFDPLFFQISPSEAETIDPQVRLLLENTYHAIEDSNNLIENFKNCGVYTACMFGHYTLHQNKKTILDYSLSSMSNRISYYFDMEGPSISLDTMCSGSLSALHMACQGIRSGDCDSAIVGAVNLMPNPIKYRLLSKGKFLSPTGSCHSFGVNADGYVPGEGVVTIVLKKKSEAIRNKDHIYGLIRGTSVGASGRTAGFTVPKVKSQSQVITKALENAKVNPESITYIEAHGTGTELGDPIEIQALTNAWQSEKKQSCAIGAVKSNIGHLESAAGLAGLIKILMQFKHKVIAPTINSEVENPLIKFDKTPFYLAKKQQKWLSENSQPRRAALSSFGAGGSNSHAILEEYQETESNNNIELPYYILTLSAKSLVSLELLLEKYKIWIKERSDKDCYAISYTTTLAREHYKFRLAFIYRDINDLRNQLDKFNNINGPYKKHELISNDSKDNKDFYNILAQSLDRYLKGEKIEWEDIFAHKQIIKLPSYTFEKEICWSQEFEESINLSEKEKNIEEEQFDSQQSPNQNEDDITNGDVKQHDGNRLFYYTPVWKEKSLSNRRGAYKNHNDSQWKNNSISIEESLDSVSKSKNVAIITSNKKLKDIANSYHYKALNTDEIENIISYIKSYYEDVRSSKNSDYGDIIFDLRELTSFEKNIRSVYECLFYFFKKLQNISNGPVENTMFYYEKTPLICKKSLFQLKSLQTPNPNQNSSRRKFNLIILVHNIEKHISEVYTNSLEGMMKSFSIENPNIRTKLVIQENTGNDNEVREEQLLVNIFQELDHMDQKNETIKYIGNQRLKRSYLNRSYSKHSKSQKNRIPIGEALDSDLDKTSSGIRFENNGLYVISGGLGAIGKIISQYLINKYNARLILLGTSAIDHSSMNNYSLEWKKGVNMKLDITDKKQVLKAINDISAKYGKINGIIHAAGRTRDKLFSRKEFEEFDEVVSIKEQGVKNLDEATSDIDLDFFVLFSSVASIYGNAGQTDYALGNSFLDHFALYRNNLQRAGRRKGRTISINWPLWENGKMSISQEQINFIYETQGILPITNEDGIESLENILKFDLDQLLILKGNQKKIEDYNKQIFSSEDDISKNDIEIGSVENTMFYYEKTPLIHKKSLFQLKSLQTQINEEAGLATIQKKPITIGESIGSDYKKEIKTDIFSMISAITKIHIDKLDEDSTLGEYGFDSVTLGKLSENIQEKYDVSISPNQFFTLNTINKIVLYIDDKIEISRNNNISLESDKITKLPNGKSNIIHEEGLIGAPTDSNDTKYSIIGINGMMPDAENLDQFWDNMLHGKNVIKPIDRWSTRSYKGGTIPRMMDFDPKFFNLSSREAMLMDPQHRLFLQISYNTFLDAGYDPANLKNVGVFVGVQFSDYQGLLQQNRQSEHPYAATGNSHTMLANRLSYLFDFRGPSETVDTACSSSIVAAKRAILALQNDECEYAIVGGVSLMIDPEITDAAKSMGVLSPDYRCATFDENANGYVRSEGIGVILLKKEKNAIRDNDNIYANIISIDENHGGRANSLTAPNPEAQKELLLKAYKNKAHIAENISYIEAHGTGTKLGDPIEIDALKAAWKEIGYNNKIGLGSVKTHIGHLEPAAGIASLLKMVLSMKSDLIPGNLNFAKLNPYINLDDSRFYIANNHIQWTEKIKTVGISSFGFGGSNTHLVLQSSQNSDTYIDTDDIGSRYIVCLSAKNEWSLTKMKDAIINKIEATKDNSQYSLKNISYTLNCGRAHFRYRAAYIVSSKEELLEELRNKNFQIANIQQNKKIDESEADLIFENDKILEIFREKYLDGYNVPFIKLYSNRTSRNQGISVKRVSLPGYAFNTQAYWFEEILHTETEEVGV